MDLDPWFQTVTTRITWCYFSCIRGDSSWRCSRPVYFLCGRSCDKCHQVEQGVAQPEIWFGLAAVACFLIVITRFGVGNKGELAIIGIVASALAGTVLEQLPRSRRSASYS